MTNITAPRGLVNSRKDLTQAYIFDTVADYQASTIEFPVGKIIHLKDRGADFEVVAYNAGANGFDEIENGAGDGRIEMAKYGTLVPERFGAVGDFRDESVLMQFLLDDPRPLKLTDNKVYGVSLQSSVGDDNYALRINNSGKVIFGQGTIKVLANNSCVVMRTRNHVSEGGDRVEGIYLKDFTIDGNWDNIVWAGPTGLEPTEYDQNGLDIVACSLFVIDNVKVNNTGQDGIVVASSDRGVLNKCVVKNTGKNNFSCFVSHDIKHTSCRGEYSNASPNEGTKPIYTLTSDGYFNFGVQGSLGDPFSPVSSSVPVTNASKNNIRYIGCSGLNKNGRNIGSIFDANNVTIDGFDGIQELDKTGVSFIMTNNAYHSNHKCSNVNIHYVSLSSNARAISATLVGDITVDKFTESANSGTNNFASMTFVDCGEVVLDAPKSINQSGLPTTTAVIDVRGTADFTLINPNIDYSLSFNTNPTGKAKITGLGNNKLVGPGNVTELDYDFITSQLILSFTVNAGATVTKDLTITGVKAQSLVSWSALTQIVGLDKVNVTASTTLDTVKLQFHNPTGTNVSVGSGTYKVRVNQLAP